jgi:hypothetical protein
MSTVIELTFLSVAQILCSLLLSEHLKLILITKFSIQKSLQLVQGISPNSLDPSSRNRGASS